MLPKMSGKLLTRCLCLFTTIPAVSCYADINILTNPGFESGLTGWSDRSATISAESSIVRTGSGSYVCSQFATWWADRLDVWFGYGIDVNYLNIQNESDYAAD
jgi:hypothetical protein